ncbi:TIGR01244 family protein [Arboricoccus pini]|uniref:TIGR01244 family protein n=1 Tax=Arboricoccus pini TaxID=1963835 RepID=A0A212Q5P9_9PROT|nr:TIGR01244 family sulfur transferase [Arboricoccus pini]SNB54685.1 TIGR01244 family protein [Arboricoccus pini]
MVEIKKVADGFYVAPQLAVEDFAELKAEGINTIINNRPDGEAPDQLSDAEAREAAEAAGLNYVHVPVVSGQMTQGDIASFWAAVDDHEGPFLAYCRTGTRSCIMWAFNAVRTQQIPAIVAAAAEAGYDARPAIRALETIKASL